MCDFRSADGTYLIHCNEASQRLDAYLSACTEFSRSRVCAMIEEGNVLVNGCRTNKKYKVEKGDEIQIFPPENSEINAVPQEIPLDIFYEDRDIIVINKPQGMVVHPAPGNPDGTLVNALLYHCRDTLSGINGKLRPGIVHRIDKDTSGLLVVAKNDEAHNALAEMFATHSFSRKYHAILYGVPKSEAGTVNMAIGRSQKDRKKMAAYPPDSPNAKNAVTHYRVLEHFQGYSYVELTLETGRTHQIRVHMQHLGCPVLADPLYAAGRENFGMMGQCLHARFIEFAHPITREILTFDSPLPPHFTQILDKFRKMI